MDNENEDQSIEIVAGPVRIKTPQSLLARFFPRLWSRGRVDAAAAEVLARKIDSGEPFDTRDQFFLKRLYATELRRQANADAIVSRAETLLLEPPQADAAGAESTSRTSDEWVVRLLRDAEDVSDESLRDLYARILAGELRRGGAFSLRTLTVVRDLDAEVAQLFEKVAPFVFDGSVLPNGWEWAPFYEKRGISYECIMRLRDAGLIASGDSIITVLDNETPETGFRTTVVFDDVRLVFWRAGKFAKPELRTWCLTRAGVELRRIPHAVPDQEYLKAYCRWVCDTLVLGPPDQTKIALLERLLDGTTRERDMTAEWSPRY